MRMFLCAIFLTVYSFVESQSGNLKLFGPDAPLVGVSGEDLVLPCFIQPSTSAVDMTVEWFRQDLGDLLVHLYKDHADRNENQAESYRGRTSLFKEELQNGNISLKLTALQASDQGEYKCLVGESGSNRVTVYVLVEVLGTHPVIMMESYDNSGGINLVCESRGWKPEPEVLWLDREGVTLPAEDTQIHRDTEGFRVKRSVTVYGYSDSNSFYCRLQQKHHMKQAEIIINSQVFCVWKWAVCSTVLACLFAVGWIVAAAIFYRRASLHRKADFIKKFAVDVMLDPDTANPELILSDDGKQVAHGDTKQVLPDTPEIHSQMRFEFPCVLGRQSFSSGRFYYEVQVSGKTEWTLGVVRENINRKEWMSRNPQNGFWTVGLRNKTEYKAYDDPPVPLRLREKVEKVGVFVDFEKALVSFYNVESHSHIYSFTDQSFTENLYPYFSPRYKNTEGGDNSAPLIITAVTEERSAKKYII